MAKHTIYIKPETAKTQAQWQAAALQRTGPAHWKKPVRKQFPAG
ncbi:hypothetical protein [Paenibacillus sp. MMS18-CY102]|nr:hypothetical protein [Paenibacillus sp. MMS18-CY102]